MSFFPLSPTSLFSGAAVGLVLAFALSRFAGHYRITRGVAAPYTRKLFHFGVYTGAAGVQLLWGFQGTMAYGSAVAAVVLLAVILQEKSILYRVMARPSDHPHPSLFIVVPLVTTAVGGLLSNVLVGEFAVVGYLVGGWGDAVGEPVGVRWGRHRYRVPSLVGVPATRSLEGSAAVFLASFLAAALALLTLNPAFGSLLMTAALCALVGAVVEGVSNHGLDNLTVQVAASITAWWLLG